MLTIPDEIKDLLHLDSCKKNIRIHFPSGERSDICNDLIVMDSVKFTESLCSQDQLKFGLCESPVFECEVVGVGNIKGATIEVSCEIYCNASVTGAEWRTDLQHYIYAIPYGTFIVSECKRQADMNHRRIQAYNIITLNLGKIGGNIKQRALYPSSANLAFTQNLVGFLSDVAQNNIFDCAMTELVTEECTGEFDEGSTGYQRYFKYVQYQITANNCNLLYHVKCDRPDFTYDDKCEYVKVVTGYVTTGRFIQMSVNPYREFDGTKITLPNSGFNEMGRYIYPNMSLNPTDTNKFFEVTVTPPSPPLPPPPSTQGTWGIFIRVMYEYERKNRDYETVEKETYCDPSDIHIYSLAPNSNITYSWDREPANGGKYAVPNVVNIELRDLLNSFTELMGRLAQVNRYGSVRTINIKQQFHLTPSGTLYPGSAIYPEGVTGGKLLPHDYQSCWYDDQYTKQFGAITCEYKNTSNEDCIFTLYISPFDADSDPESYQVYELNGNEIIDNSTWTDAQIQAICETIASNIAGVTYMPVEFVGRGLPYVEAGDTFEILTASNDSITTIVLNRTLSGEQVLTDSYKSV